MSVRKWLRVCGVVVFGGAVLCFTACEGEDEVKEVADSLVEEIEEERRDNSDGDPTTSPATGAVVRPLGT
jgi:hypothetical protein